MSHIQPQLFCFTHAGGTADFFNIIENDLQGIEVTKLEYAGHGSRFKEPLYDGFGELAEDILEQIRQRYKGGEYALFGYSMGSIAAAEVLRRILITSLKSPKHVFLAAHEPHTKEELAGFADEESDELVKERTIRFGAVPERLINNRPFWRTYLPMYRADYSMIGKYRFDELDLTTDIPATVFYSPSDTPSEEMRLWGNYFSGDCDFIEFSGPHFFINQYHEDMAKIIRIKLLGE